VSAARPAYRRWCPWDNGSVESAIDARHPVFPEHQTHGIARTTAGPWAICCSVRTSDASACGHGRPGVQVSASYSPGD